MEDCKAANPLDKGLIPNIDKALINDFHRTGLQAGDIFFHAEFYRVNAGSSAGFVKAESGVALFDSKCLHNPS